MTMRISKNHEQKPKKTLADVRRKKTKAVKKETRVNRDFATCCQRDLTEALNGVKSQADLRAYRERVESQGTSAQRQQFDRLNAAFKKEARMLLDTELANITSRAQLESIRSMLEENGSAEQKARFAQYESYFQKPTWQKYSDLHGIEYNAPKSGVGEADRRAEQIIAGNQRMAELAPKEADATRKGLNYLENQEKMNKAKTIISDMQNERWLNAQHAQKEAEYSEWWNKALEEKELSKGANKFKKFGKYALIAGAAGLLGYGIFKGIKSIFNNDSDDKSLQQAEVVPENNDNVSKEKTTPVVSQPANQAVGEVSNVKENKDLAADDKTKANVVAENAENNNDVKAEENAVSKTEKSAVKSQVQASRAEKIVEKTEKPAEKSQVQASGAEKIIEKTEKPAEKSQVQASGAEKIVEKTEEAEPVQQTANENKVAETPVIIENQIINSVIKEDNIVKADTVVDIIKNGITVESDVIYIAKKAIAYGK